MGNLCLGDDMMKENTKNSKQAFLRVKNLIKSYGEDESKIEVLKNINVEIEQGKICVLLGPSGSGKSTFLNIMGGLEKADSGEVYVGDTVLTSLNDRALGEYRREQLGFVFQFYNLVPDLTVKENIEVCKHISSDPLDIDDLLHALGLWEHRNKFPQQISGGQQQRCAIGRALVKKPNLLLCDEPTGALDYKTSKEILELMEMVNKDYGCTIIIVTHNDAIKNMAHRILRLRDGELIGNEANTQLVAARDLEW